MEKRPHTPLHWIKDRGHYILTAGTYTKAKLFRTDGDMDFLQDLAFDLASAHKIELDAWSFFPNHYHLIVQAGATLPVFIRKLHSISAREINQRQGVAGRKVWYQYWDTLLEDEKSYYSRLNYVNTNPVHHGIVQRASQYRWCSAASLEANATRAFLETLRQFHSTNVKVRDDF